MNISFVRPPHKLQPYIESFWLLQSPIGLPSSATSIAAPNGLLQVVKLIGQVLAENPAQDKLSSHEDSVLELETLKFK